MNVNNFGILNNGPCVLITVIYYITHYNFYYVFNIIESSHPRGSVPFLYYRNRSILIPKSLVGTQRAMNHRGKMFLERKKVVI